MWIREGHGGTIYSSVDQTNIRLQILAIFHEFLSEDQNKKKRSSVQKPPQIRFRLKILASFHELLSEDQRKKKFFSSKISTNSFSRQKSCEFSRILKWRPKKKFFSSKISTNSFSCQKSCEFSRILKWRLKKRSSVQKFPQIRFRVKILVCFSSQIRFRSSFHEFFSENPKKKVCPKTYRKSGVSPQKLRKFGR